MRIVSMQSISYACDRTNFNQLIKIFAKYQAPILSNISSVIEF